jgi:hypothetical protein
MLAGTREPSQNESHGGRNANQNHHGGERREHEQNLPDKITETCGMPPLPISPDVTLAGYNAIEQNESHHAVQIDQQNP